MRRTLASPERRSSATRPQVESAVSSVADCTDSDRDGEKLKFGRQKCTRPQIWNGFSRTGTAGLRASHVGPARPVCGRRMSGSE